MQTNFTPEQLKDPRISEVNDILRSCVHCGFCTATCPTYVLLGDERDSPRGRIYLMKDMFEGGRDASKEVAFHVDRCLSCLSCMTTCPSSVDYMHLVDHARVHIEQTRRRTIKDRFVRGLLAFVVPYPGRFRVAIASSVFARPFRGWLARLGLKEMAALVGFAPSPLSLVRGRRMSLKSPRGETKGRVIMLAGCAQQVLRPDINAATAHLLGRMGYEVVVPPRSGCCGALVHHMGREKPAHRQATRNVDVWSGVMDEGPVEAIIINASGCGTTVKDYGHMLHLDPEYSERAAEVSRLTRDISEFLAGFDLGAPKRWSSLRVAYHSACSMQHGQRISTAPRRLLENAGFAVVEIGEGHICCGSAGTYNLLQPELATELRDRKIENIERVQPDIVATGNIGCITQLQSGTDIPVVHTVELLDWAYGGPCPRGLERFQDRVREVPDPGPLAEAE